MSVKSSAYFSSNRKYRKRTSHSITLDCEDCTNEEGGGGEVKFRSDQAFFDEVDDNYRFMRLCDKCHDNRIIEAEE